MVRPAISGRDAEFRAALVWRPVLATRLGEVVDRFAAAATSPPSFFSSNTSLRCVVHRVVHGSKIVGTPVVPAHVVSALFGS